MKQMEALRNVLREEAGITLLEDAVFAQHTTFRIGGNIALLAQVESKEQAAVCLRAAKAQGIRPFFLGKGSNLLVSDAGYAGFVLKYMSRMERMHCADTVLTVEAGMTLAQIAVYAQEQGLTGMEFAHGIPGTLGGAIWMNAGAYEGEMAQIVEEVCVLDSDGMEHVFLRGNLGFGYRSSRFQGENLYIISAKLRLTRGDKAEILAKMQDLMQRRRSKQPLEFPSAGSTFKRPEGHFAGAMIEQAGLKGFMVGGAQISEKHAGFVVNVGQASCEDVLRLMRAVRQVVQMDTGIVLEPEIQLLGCDL